jgi:6-phosphogluconolactonase
LAVSPNQQYLYAVNEVDTGGVSAFRIDPVSGKLKALNKVSSHGSGPCHLVVERGGRWVYTANYNNGSIAALPVQSDGSLGEATVYAQHSGSSVNAERQKGPHAHATVLSPDNRWLFVADLGLDQVIAYPIEGDSGGLNVRDAIVLKMTPGSGPRHLAFRGDGKYVYVLGEMSSTVTISMLPDGYNGPKSGAEIAVRGAFLYASNRGHNSIATFKIDGATGHLTAAGHTPTQGKTPRNFAIDPTGGFLLAANQDSNNVVLFRVDGKSGALTPSGEVWSVDAPVCVAFSNVK